MARVGDTAGPGTPPTKAERGGVRPRVAKYAASPAGQRLVRVTQPGEYGARMQVKATPNGELQSAMIYAINCLETCFCKGGPLWLPKARHRLASWSRGVG